MKTILILSKISFKTQGKIPGLSGVPSIVNVLPLVVWPYVKIDPLIPFNKLIVMFWQFSIYIIWLLEEDRYILSKEKDWDWYLAKVVGKDNYFAFWNTQREALIELKNVIEMIRDFYEEQIAEQKQIESLLLVKEKEYAL